MQSLTIGAPISRWGFNTSDSALKRARRVPGGSIPSSSPDGEADKVGWWWSNVYCEIESVCALSHVPIPQKVFEHAGACECFLDLLAACKLHGYCSMSARGSRMVCRMRRNRLWKFRILEVCLFERT